MSNIEQVSSLALVVSVLFDLRFGEPPARVHPVVWLGCYLALKDRLLDGSSTARLRFLLGTAFVLVGAGACGGLSWALQRGLAALPGWLELPLLALALKPFFSLSALLRAGETVQHALAAGDLADARRLLGWHLVSRNTAALSTGEVAGAAVASLAENLTDSVVAPLFYAALFGLPGIVVYRFVNTADAVLGYRTAELEHFGKAAARTDDLLNIVPARLSALLLLGALALTGRPVRRAWRGLAQDRRRTPSPNGGWTMAAVAWGLGVRLDKRDVYALNERGRTPAAADIATARRLVGLATALGFGLYALIAATLWLGGRYA